MTGQKPKVSGKVTAAEIHRVLSALGGRIGGKATTEKKRQAVRLNGLKGGRPRKRQLEMKLET